MDAIPEGPWLTSKSRDRMSTDTMGQGRLRLREQILLIEVSWKEAK